MVLLQMDDASPLTFWSAPPVSIVLEYVYCKKCNQSADLNISTGSVEDSGIFKTKNLIYFKKLIFLL